MTRVSRLFVLLGLGLAVAGCTRTLDMSALNRSISEGVGSQLGLPIATVDCPTEGRAQQAGDSFECTATPQAGGRLTVTVTQKDDAGNVSWEVTKTEGLLDLDLVEASVKDGLKSQAQVDATVDCPGRWKGSTPGDVFECQATTDDQELTIAVTITDADGNVSWKAQ